jgi:hypothetical protein
MFRSRWTVAVATATGLAAGAIAFGVGLPSSSAAGGLPTSPVVVTNTNANPVPVSGTVNVGNLPATQAISGNVSVSNFPATQPVSGSVSVSNLPATQAVSGTVGIDPANNQVRVANLPAVQNVSGTVGIDPAHNTVQEDFTTQVVPVSPALANPVSGVTYVTDSAVDATHFEHLTIELVNNGSPSCNGGELVAFDDHGVTQLKQTFVGTPIDYRGTIDNPSPHITIVFSALGNCQLDVLIFGRGN